MRIKSVRGTKTERGHLAAVVDFKGPRGGLKEKVIAREARGPCPEGFERFVVYANWEPRGDYEELDVDVKRVLWPHSRRGTAKRLAQAVLEKDYNPGGKVRRIRGPMVGLYM